MTDLAIGGGALVAILILLSLRVPIAFVLGGVSFVGIILVRGWNAALNMLGTLPHSFASSWELSAVPMFLLMGAAAFQTGLTQSLYSAARLWLNKLPSGLAVATNFTAAGFAAASGSSVATSAAVGRLAIPEMLKYGYDKGLATGTVAASGTLGAVYTLMIILRCMKSPELAPKMTEQVTLKEKMQALAAVWPMPVLVLAVIGSIYSGIATPTEAGAVGAVMAFVIGAAKGKLTWAVLWRSMDDTMNTTASLFFLAIGAVILTRFLAIAGVPTFIAEVVSDLGLGPIQLVIAMAIVFLLLGMFLDPIGVMLVTLPIFLPAFEAADLNLIWIGVIVVKMIEIGLLTPPVGINVYVVKQVAGESVPLSTVFRGVSWFLACEVFIMVLLVAVPALSLWLPAYMGH
ncbi:TRAP transporter large permease [Neptunicoccus cionae]|uniref:TRAP transporter large permease n=1 Tax=Neptunicoccus cionae TaxID=2035344 RepID=UPI000C77CD8D|nr:TRAP transporter large permease subunit [Amylibacter cionae]PLS23430.1 C4-dicarboxylate ABC transporter [Amylibacter cionae]